MSASRDRAVELIEQGEVSMEDMLLACLVYMSDGDILDMLQSNYFVADDELAEPDVDEATEWADFDPDC